MMVPNRLPFLCWTVKSIEQLRKFSVGCVRRKLIVAKAVEKAESIQSLDRTRNVGIMAHIDAGKTTTTERFLYYSGVIAHPGEVHHGDTVTDFLPQERERGITIQSAVVTFPWKDHTINLIDTPGHVDFTFEVQRSLRVVDSAIAILDASAGVEAQTLTVWRQAAEYHLPKLIFLNKMDKGSASVDACLKSIEKKLMCKPLLLQIPVFNERHSGKGTGLSGLIDLVNMKQLVFDQYSKGAEYHELDVSHLEHVIQTRLHLIEAVADVDSTIAEKIIETESTDSITSSDLVQALKRICVSNTAVLVLLGSSYKNIGVQMLLDAVIQYLPYPGETSIKDPVLKAYGKQPCAFAFKTLHDAQLGFLTFLRVFSGNFTSGSKIFNVSRNKNEKIGKLYMPMADEISETREIGPGQVAIASALKETYTGDTITCSASTATNVETKLKGLESSVNSSRVKAILEGVEVPEPVFFCSIEPPSINEQKKLDFALDCMQREDPSLHVHIDPDSGQTILSGMGELHLDIVKQRLFSDFKVDADLGKIQVAYKETILQPINKRIVFERRLADHRHCVTIELEVLPSKVWSSDVKLYKGRDREKCENLSYIHDRQLKLVQNGVNSSLRIGPKLGLPVIHIEVILNWFETARGTSDTIIEAAAASCITQCLQSTDVYICEPWVHLEVTVDEKYNHAVIDDLNRRRFIMQSIDNRDGNKMIQGSVPLSELMGYSTALRTLSSGLATFSMQFKSYELVNNSHDEQKIITSIRGF